MGNGWNKKGPFSRKIYSHHVIIVASTPVFLMDVHDSNLRSLHSVSSDDHRSFDFLSHFFDALGASACQVVNCLNVLHLWFRILSDENITENLFSLISFGCRWSIWGVVLTRLMLIAHRWSIRLGLCHVFNHDWLAPHLHAVRIYFLLNNLLLFNWPLSFHNLSDALFLKFDKPCFVFSSFKCAVYLVNL